MKTISKHIPAGELPSVWRKRGGFGPDDRVTLTMEAEDPALTALRQEIENAIAQSERGESRPFDDASFERIKEHGRRRLAKGR